MTNVVVPARVRPMREHDLAQVITVEQRAYEFPWTEGIFRDCLRAGYSCWSVVAGERSGQEGTGLAVLIGYGIMTVAVEEAHILNLCTDPHQQRRGHARRLLGHLLGTARIHGAASIFLEVRPSNLAAQALYADEGFVQVGLRKAYYPASTGREDALVLRRLLTAADAPG